MDLELPVVGLHVGPKGSRWMIRQHQCAQCGKLFASAGPRATYCHVNCRVMAWSIRRRERRREARRAIGQLKAEEKARNAQQEGKA